jgi:hypothetical protein
VLGLAIYSVDVETYFDVLDFLDVEVYSDVLGSD